MAVLRATAGLESMYAGIRNGVQHEEEAGKCSAWLCLSLSAIVKTW